MKKSIFAIALLLVLNAHEHMVNMLTPLPLQEQ
mgnify:CR=1 FL=1